MAPKKVRQETIFRSVMKEYRYQYEIAVVGGGPAGLAAAITAARLGVSTALTTLIAAEMTGTFYGLGSMIQTAQIYFRMDKVMLGIICIGVIGFILDRLLLLAEKKLTRWK